ncbi:MAG: arylsulfatase [Planctomycetes bacterium]|nr:arylsulfatase [Planctomycetota bacterium]
MLANLAAVVAGAQRLPAGGAPAASRPLDGQPNIVIILADDMGFSDAGCYGSQIATPNLDRLAATGLRFTQLYNTTRCCPTRAALLTGLYPHQCGIGHMTDDRGVPGYRGRLNEHCVTIAEVLRQSGYHTWMSGKWHLGMERTEWPIEHGFERYFGQLSGACNYFRPEPGRVMALDDSVYRSFGDHFYITDAITDYAVRFLDGADRDARPFFLYVAYTAPHAPLHAWPSDIAKYRGKYRIGWDAVRQRRYERMIELGIIERAWALSPRPPEVPAWEAVTDPDEQDLRMSVYAAQIDRMDQGIGRILDRIRRLGMEHSTLVMFLSDNGGDSEDIDEGKPGAPVGTADSYRGYAPPWANVSNAPFRRYKRQVHEGGIATPLIVRWPAVVRRGDGLRHAPGHVIDLMPTCLDAAGVKYPARWDDHDITPTPGRSLLPVFRGEAAGAHDCLFWEHEGNWAVRCGNFKLVAVEGGEAELYDLAADRTEMHNLAAQRPDVVKSLRGKYDEWARQCNVVPWDKLPARVPKQPNGSS